MPEDARCIAGRYELAAPLGEGGMGLVWRARDTKLGRIVAVKLLSHATVGNETARARLIREARAAAALEHPAIIRVYDVGETDDGGAFLVMELIRGQSFRSMLHQGWMGLRRRVGVLVDVAHALHFAHGAGIVHRDVKPDNVMIRDDGHVTVVDFGIAKPVQTATAGEGETIAVAEPAKNLTLGGQLVGTPAYLAPEQARGGEVSAATDQFALAVTAYEALSGRLPWKGEGAADLVASVLRDDPPPISSCSHAPPVFDAILARALAKDPADRYPTMLAFADAMAQAAGALDDDEDRNGNLSADRGSGRLAKSGSVKLGAKTPGASTNGGQASPAVNTEAPWRLPTFKPIIALAAVGFGIYALLKLPSRGSSTTKSTAEAGAQLAAYACPPFEVMPDSEAWLGSAAAALTCERLALIHGGADAQTLVPAELWDTPRGLTSEVSSVHPWNAPDARATAIAAAKSRAARWIDGKLERAHARYDVTFSVRDADGREISQVSGHGVEIFEAVGEAIQGLVDSPTPGELTELHEQLDLESATDALGVDDVRTSILIEDLVALKEACAQLDAHHTLA
ncbi:MAG TPA: serine/threonine-protein kinase, partial [Byssovorax sp.]